jgi:hypothetical protein
METTFLRARGVRIRSWASLFCALLPFVLVHVYHAIDASGYVWSLAALCCMRMPGGRGRLSLRQSISQSTHARKASASPAATSVIVCTPKYTREKAVKSA